MNISLNSFFLVFFFFQICWTFSYDIGAYYFGNWHVDPLNEEYHGTNWTEWQLLKLARPRFPGHQQPKIPLWGYQDEADPIIFSQKIAAAHHYGINYFLFDWYWHQNTGPFLSRALEQGYMKAPNSNQVKFAIMWANHDWVDIHPMKRKWNNLLQFPGAVNRTTFNTIINHVIDNYFLSTNYYKVPDYKNNKTSRDCPFFSIYLMDTLLNGLGSVNATQDALIYFRKQTLSKGIPCLHINVIDYGLNSFSDPNQIIAELEIDSVTSYCWIHNVFPPNFPVTNYEFMTTQSVDYWKRASQKFKIPYIPNVSVGWDPSPRAAQSDIYENTGYPFTPIFSSNKTEFKNALQLSKQYLDSKCDPSWCQLTINAWNEWSEGSYLEPENSIGYGYLEAIKEVFLN